MQVGNGLPFSTASFESLLLPQQGQTAEGHIIWGFTVEQLSASGSELVLIPALTRPVSTVGLRERLLHAAQQNPAAQPPLATAPSLRAPDGQPQAKRRKAVAAQPAAEPDSKAGGLALLLRAVNPAAEEDARPSAASEAPSRERKSSKRSTPTLPPLAQPLPHEIIKQQGVLKDALSKLLQSGASEARICDLFREHRHLYQQDGSAAHSIFDAEFLVAVFESLPALREQPDDRRKIGRALGLLGSSGSPGHLLPASLGQLRRALEFLATAGTVTPDLVAQLLLDANTTGRDEWVERTQAYRPRNQFTKNSGVRGFAPALLTMFTAQSQAATVDAAQLCGWARWLGRMFAQDKSLPTGAALFTAACATLGKEAHVIAQVKVAFNEGKAGHTPTSAAASSKDKVASEEADSEETESDDGVEYEEVESSGTAILPGGYSAIPRLIYPVPPGPTSSSSSSRSSSSSSSSSSSN